jgi:primary-amine oxidase
VRPEDYPVMPCDQIGFALKPVGFFESNPALDVPPEEPQHARAAGGCGGGGSSSSSGSGATCPLRGTPPGGVLNVTGNARPKL